MLLFAASALIGTIQAAISVRVELLTFFDGSNTVFNFKKELHSNS